MIYKKNLFLFCSIFVISLVFIIYFFASNKKILELKDQNSHSITQERVKLNQKNKSQNKYYYVYLKQHNGDPDTSFIPEKLNPGFIRPNGSHISIKYNDYGSLIEDEKMILINNYKISSSNKYKIRSIVGEKNYVEALKEIQEYINNTKEVVLKYNAE